MSRYLLIGLLIADLIIIVVQVFSSIFMYAESHSRKESLFSGLIAMSTSITIPFIVWVFDSLNGGII